MTEVFNFICENYGIIKETIPITHGMLGISSLLSISNEILELSSFFEGLFHVFLKLIEKKNCAVIKVEVQGKEPEHMNMLEKIRAMQNEENFEDSGGELYESVVEANDMKLYIKAYLIKSHNLIASIPLTQEEKRILDEFMN